MMRARVTLSVTTLALGVALVLTFAPARRAAAVADLIGIDDVQYHQRQISGMVCSPPAGAIHRFSPRDHSAAYVFDGSCTIEVDRQPVKLTYHVEAYWNPAVDQGVALEVVKIGGLRQVWSDMGDPEYAQIREICRADPWLNDVPCGMENRAAGQALVNAFPRLTGGPYPLSRGAIPAGQRTVLKAEYDLMNAPPAPPAPPPLKVVHKPAMLYHAKYEPGPVTSMLAGQTITVAVKVSNLGRLTWTPRVFRLSYHWFTGPTAVSFNGNYRADLAAPVGTYQAAQLNITVQAPSTPGAYLLKWDMVQEDPAQGTTWFSTKGSPTLDQTVTVGSQRAPGVPRTPLPAKPQ